MAVYRFHKRLGETPLQALSRLRTEENISEDVSVTFAGRLDPAAMGEMIFVSGEDILNKEKYLSAEKIYEVKFLLGLSTDTGDLLGIITSLLPSPEVSQEQLQVVFRSLLGTRQQKFHSFSSKVVDGKPLWQHAREGGEVEAVHEVTFHSIEILSSESISTQSIFEKVLEITSLVSGDFRQPEILESWQPYKNPLDQLHVITVRVHSSSGAYMRVLGEEVGEKLKVPVCAYSIERKQVLL